MREMVAAVLMAALVSVTPRPAAALGIGDPAPKLAVSQFVKGEPVTDFDKGKVYVVEFWATWCGPCRVSIPHLSELAKKHGDVTFIGVDVWETDPTKVQPFVTEMGDKMSYRVALDTVADAAKPDDGLMANTWMKAAGQSGIPAAFIVNGEGKIAWIGHPMAMEQPLDEIAAGKWNMDKAVTDSKMAADRQAKFGEFRQKLAAAGQDPDVQLTTWREYLMSDPEAEKQFGMNYWMMLNQRDAEAGHKYGKRLLHVYKNDPQALNAFAWTLVDPARHLVPTQWETELALRAATRADDLSDHKNAEILDTLAAAYYRNNQFGKAIEAQRAAVSLATDDKLKADMQTRVGLYVDAAKSSHEMAVDDWDIGSRPHLK